MPAKDLYHETVKHALIKDGWTITHDPFPLKYGRKTLYADLGAERLLVAEKGREKIVVEIKSFLGASHIHDLQEAIGQYVMYAEILRVEHIDAALYLAVPETTYKGIFSSELGQLLIARTGLRLIVFDKTQEVITKWTSEQSIKP